MGPHSSKGGSGQNGWGSSSRTSAVSEDRGLQGSRDRQKGTGGRKLAGLWEVRLQEWKVQEEARSAANTDNRQGVEFAQQADQYFETTFTSLCNQDKHSHTQLRITRTTAWAEVTCTSFTKVC